MNFEEFWNRLTAIGLEPDGAARALAASAWDAALCAASAAAFDQGKLRDADTIHAGIRALHTWNTTPLS